jgi:hypothetical protein
MRPHLWMTLALFAITGAVYAQALDHRFTSWDDDVNVSKNRVLLEDPLGSIPRFWREPYYGFYSPLTRTAWAVLASLAREPLPAADPAAGASPPAAREAGGSRLAPRPFHLANVLVHALNAVLVFAIARRLVRADGAAFAGALVFALHPLQAEPVAWVTGLKDLLAGLFSLLAIRCYLRFAGAGSAERSPRDTRRRRLDYALSLFGFALALLSKPAAVAVPVALFVLDRFALRRTLADCARSLAPWLALAGPLMLLTTVTESELGVAATPWWGRPFVAGDALAFYLWKLAWPLELLPEYGRRPERVLAHAWGYVGWLAPAALAWLAWRRRERWPWLLVGLGVFFAGVLPVLGLVPFVYQYFSTVADRYAYTAMLGPALAVSGLGARIAERRAARSGSGAAALAACAAVLLLWTFQTSRQIAVWRDDAALYRHALRGNPDSWVAHLNLARALEAQGRPEEALAHFLEVVRIAPGSALAYDSVGAFLQNQGRPDEAIPYHEQAVRAAPARWESRHLLATALASAGRIDAAIAEERAALAADPASAVSRTQLAALLDRRGQVEEALRLYEEAIALDPGFAPARRARDELRARGAR